MTAGTLRRGVTPPGSAIDSPMAGQPALRIGAHGNIVREYLGGGVWLARIRFRDSNGVTRRVQRLGPPDEFDRHGKLAEDALSEALAERRPPVEVDALGPETLVARLVQQHLDRLAEDGRSPATLATYEFAAAKLEKFIGGLRYGGIDVPPGRRAEVDAYRTRGEDGQTSQDNPAWCPPAGRHGQRLNANPVRDVQPLQAKSQPKGASALSANELRALLLKIKASAFCHEHDLVDPVTLLIATGLRRSELLALRWKDFDADAGTLAVEASWSARRDRLARVEKQDGGGKADVAVALVRRRHADDTPHGELLRRTADDLPFNSRHLARP